MWTCYHWILQGVFSYGFVDGSNTRSFHRILPNDIRLCDTRIIEMRVNADDFQGHGFRRF